ncbi:hypothetical protein SNE40_020548 [Patella caerulea]|uniref:Diacylglycerol O-acyltransferase n=1 Tax=Patella caerulea TaxID=87958 RepID=A0AAN8GE66_PATCE
MERSIGRDDRHDTSYVGWVERGQDRIQDKKGMQMSRPGPGHERYTQQDGRTSHRNSAKISEFKSGKNQEGYQSDNQKAPGSAHRSGYPSSNQPSRRSSTHSIQPASKSKTTHQLQSRDFMANEKSIPTYPKSVNQTNLPDIRPGPRTSQRNKRPTSLQDIQPSIHQDRSPAKYSTLPSKRSSLPPNTAQYTGSHALKHHEKHQKHYKRSISAPQSNDVHEGDMAMRPKDVKYSTLQGQRHHGSHSSSNIKYSTLQSSRRSLQSVITEQPISENLDFEFVQTPVKKSTKPDITSSPSRVSFQNIPVDKLDDISLDLPSDPETPNFTLSHSTIEKHRHQVQLGFPSAPYHTIPLIFRKNTCFSCFSVFTLVFFSLLIFIPFTVILIILVPVCYIVKRLFDCLCFCPYWRNCCVYCCHDHLTGSEHVWIESEMQSTMVAQSLIIVEHGLDIHKIRDLINIRLISAENRRGKRLYPRFRQKAAPFCCGYAWVNDSDFVINNHVFNMPNYIKTLDELQEYTSEMACKGLPMEHPLWEIQVLVNYGQQKDTVLLFRMHPCMTDGVSLVRILEQALVDTHTIQPADLNFAGTSSCLQSFKAFFLGPVTFFRKYLCLKRDFNLIHGRHIHPSGKTVVAWSEPFSLSAATRIKQVARCTLNELFFSIAAANMRRYMQVNGISNPYDMHCAVPTDFNTDQSTISMGNKYTFVVLPLPTNIEGAIPRLWETKLSMEQFKSSPEAAIVRNAMWFTHATLPKSSCHKFWRNIYKKCTCLLSNLVGPKSVLKLASREIKCIIYWLPPLDDIAVSISFITYGEQIRMAVVSDRSVLPNPELLTTDFFHQLETLSQLLANRRIPGEQLNRKMENAQLLSGFTLKDLTIDQMQLQMTLLQQEIHEIKLQLDASSSHRISHSEAHLMQRIENLKEQFREIMVELRQKRAEENESAVIIADECNVEDETDIDRPQKPFRRRTLSMSSRMSTASVSSTVRPLSTTTSNQPSPTQTFLPSWPEFEVHDVEKALQSSSKPSYKKHRLSTMDEYQLDDTITESDEKRYQTY